MIPLLLSLSAVTMTVTDAQIETIGTAWPLCWAVESSYSLDPQDGDGGRAVGPLQIWPDVVIDANKQAGRMGFDIRFTLEDRRDIHKSIAIFTLYCLCYEAHGSVREMCNLWHWGPRWREKDDGSYWRKCQVP